MRFNEAGILLGSFEKNILNIEVANGHVQGFRRAVYLKHDVDVNTIIKESDIVCLRPNKGIDARRYKDFIGAKTKRAIRAFEILSLDDFEF
jgi:sialic acid synthase SpsE